jgi:hypothetical protein
MRRLTGSLGKGFSCLAHDSFKAGGIMDSHLAQLLPVQGHTCKVESMDEPTVVQVMLHQRSTDSGDPERTILTLLFLATAEGVRAGIKDRSGCLAACIISCAKETF